MLCDKILFASGSSGLGVKLMNVVEQIRPFLEPKSVALVGLSRRTGVESFSVLESMLETGYKGELYPVNPKANDILGVKAYSSVGDLPDGIDLAVILTPREIVPEMVRACGEKGIESVVIIGQGFADGIDDEGKRLQEDIVNIAKENGVRVVGPNTIGSANAFFNFTLSFARPFNMEKIPVGLISQSGLFFGKIGELNMIGKGIDIGNGCDVDQADCLEYFEADQDIKVIALHIEGIKNGKRFMQVARRVARKKPIVVLKTGRTQKSAKAAQSHTGSIIGDDEVWDAVIKQCGLIRVDSIDEMSDLLKFFSYMPVIQGRGVGIVSFSGGLGIHSIDSCEKYGLKIVELSPEARQNIVDLAPPWLGVGNPLDLWPVIMVSRHPIGEAFRDSLHIVMKDQNVNVAILVLAAWMERITPSLTDILIEVAEAFPNKAMVLCPYEGWVYNVFIDELEEKLQKTGKMLVLPASDRAARALGRAAEYSEFLKYG